MDLRIAFSGLFLAAALPLNGLAQTSDFRLPQLDLSALRAMDSGAKVPQAAAAPVQLAAGQESALLVKLDSTPMDISAATEWGQVPEGLRKARITVEVAGEQGVLQDITLEVTEVKGDGKYAPGTGELRRGDASTWEYLPFTEPKTEKHPKALRVTIVPKHKGRICGEPVQVNVKPVFMHLTFVHAHNPGERTQMPGDDDHERAWKYVKWKYGVDTSKLTSIKYDKKLATMGATNLGIGGMGRNMRLGPTAFNEENICASVIGHENVHGGQSVLTLLGPSKYAETPAYQWEIDNAARLGVDASYIQECRAFQKWYQGTGPRPD